MIMIRVQAVTNNIYQLFNCFCTRLNQLGSRASKLVFVEGIFKDTTYRVNAIEFVHAQKKSIYIILIIEYISFIHSPVVNMVKLTCFKAYISHISLYITTWKPSFQVGVDRKLCWNLREILI